MQLATARIPDIHPSILTGKGAIPRPVDQIEQCQLIAQLQCAPSDEFVSRERTILSQAIVAGANRVQAIADPAMRVHHGVEHPDESPALEPNASISAQELLHMRRVENDDAAMTDRTHWARSPNESEHHLGLTRSAVPTIIDALFELRPTPHLIELHARARLSGLIIAEVTRLRRRAAAPVDEHRRCLRHVGGVRTEGVVEVAVAEAVQLLEPLELLTQHLVPRAVIRILVGENVVHQVALVALVSSLEVEGRDLIDLHPLVLPLQFGPRSAHVVVAPVGAVPRVLVTDPNVAVPIVGELVGSAVTDPGPPLPLRERPHLTSALILESLHETLARARSGGLVPAHPRSLSGDGTPLELVLPCGDKLSRVLIGPKQVFEVLHQCSP